MDKDVALEQIFDDLIFHETLNIIFDTHRAVKKGLRHVFGSGQIVLSFKLYCMLLVIRVIQDIFSITKNRQRLI